MHWKHFGGWVGGELFDEIPIVWTGPRNQNCSKTSLVILGQETQEPGFLITLTKGSWCWRVSFKKYLKLNQMNKYILTKSLKITKFPRCIQSGLLKLCSLLYCHLIDCVPSLPPWNVCINKNCLDCHHKNMGSIDKSKIFKNNAQYMIGFLQTIKGSASSEHVNCKGFRWRTKGNKALKVEV